VLTPAGAVPVTLHEVAQMVPLHTKSLQELMAPGVQLPDPLHAPWAVCMSVAHDAAPHIVELPGYTQAPLVLQSLAPQGAPVVHALEQQCPVPPAPQIPLEHAPLLVHI
jgi:hypothetical protein